MVGSLLRRLFRSPIKDDVRTLIDRATELGLRSEDRENALNALEYNEAAEAFDTVVTQLYEYDIEIDPAFLKSAQEIGDRMKLDRHTYDILEKLVRTNP